MIFKSLEETVPPLHKLCCTIWMMVMTAAACYLYNTNQRHVNGSVKLFTLFSPRLRFERTLRYNMLYRCLLVALNTFFS